MTATFSARSTADDVLAGRDLSGRNVLVTGCNAGIGFETARSLAAGGAHVIAACRDQPKADATVARIRERHPQARLSPLALDLASFQSIRSAAVNVAVDELHALVCNAGLYSDRYGETADGLELTVGVCHFGHFLLTSLLMDKLRKAAPARVVMVSSESHRHPAKLHFERFPSSASRYRPLIAYGQAKLCNVLFANQLTRRHQHEGVYASSLHPGTMVLTSIYRDSIPAKLLALAMSPFAKSIAQAAATSVYCATAPELETRGGSYFVDCKERAMSREAADVQVAERLWALTEERISGKAV
jgi:WW domain-containing oxidoreductase